MNLNVEEPYWIELDAEEDLKSYQEELAYYLNKFGEPIILVYVLKNARLYNKVKLASYDQNVIT